MPVPMELPSCSTARLPRLWEGEPVPVLAEGYVETEYLLSGSARTYTGPITGPVVVASCDSRYVTRILVRYPKRPRTSAAASSSNRSTRRSGWTATHCGREWVGCCRRKAMRGSGSRPARWVPPSSEG